MSAPVAAPPPALLEVAGLAKTYPLRRGPFRRPGALRAVAGVDLVLGRGECVALVGESGSGKTTFVRAALRLIEPTAGRVRFDGHDLLALPAAPLRRLRRRFQIVFQDPYGSLDPRQRVGEAVAEPIAIHHRGLSRGERRRRVDTLLLEVGLKPDLEGRFPHELSGGERQRVAIARALAPGPELLVADEPVSALDASVRSQILNLLADLRERMGLTLLLIAHDLAMVEQLADRVAVFYLGRIVEEALCAELFARPLHPYTALLLAAVPVPDPRRRALRAPPVGEMPDPAAAPGGCPFHPRCPSARARCAAERPELSVAGPGHRVACFYPGEVSTG